MGGKGQKYQVNLFWRKQRVAPLHFMRRGVFVPSRDIPGIKFRKRK